MHRNFKRQFLQNIHEIVSQINEWYIQKLNYKKKYILDQTIENKLHRTKSDRFIGCCLLFFFVVVLKNML